MIPLNDLSRDKIHPGYINEGCYLNGPALEIFERRFAEYLGSEYFVGLGNGMDSLEIALRCLDIGEGDKVAVAPNAGMYGTLAVMNCGATPIFMDVHPKTLCIAELEDCDAVIVTHLYGQPSIDVIEKARAKNIDIIEDCSHAHGAMINGKKVGTLGDIGVFSFYPTKNLGAYGNAGGISCSQEYIEKARALGQFRYGMHSQMDEIQAAVLAAKLPFLDEKNSKRKAIRTYYKHVFGNKVEFVGYDDSVVHLCVIQVEDRASFKPNNVSTAVHYPILDYRQSIMDIEAYCPIAEQTNEKIVTIPCFPEMTDNEIEYVATAVNNVC